MLYFMHVFYLLLHFSSLVLNPATNLQINDVTNESITLSWTAPDGYFDDVTVYCEGLYGAVSVSIQVPRDDDQMATCTDLTPGALYNIILETSLHMADAPPVNATDEIKTTVTGNLEAIPRPDCTATRHVPRPDITVTRHVP
jgi:hypothetical protein